jgi:glycosyltransferase involved in cell wall biosynthesis
VRGIDRHYVRSLSFVDFLKGRGPVHDHARTRAQAANEALILAGMSHVAGRTEWDRRLASVLAPQAVYHHCDEPMRPAFHRAAWTRDSATPGEVFSTSGHYAKKGVGTLLRAVDALSRVVPETTLVLAGMAPGSDNERATMRHARALGVAERVRVLAELDAEALAAELSQASVFVNSSHIENSSNALCEAQLVGVPCIASSAGGLVTLADDGSAALLVQDGDPTALAGALLSLLGDPEEAFRLGERGRVIATARHDRDSIRAQIRSVYDAVLA